MPRTLAFAALSAAVLLGGCATTMRPGPVDVTRYHLGAPLSGGSVMVEPLTGYAGISPEDRLYADAVSGALAQRGFAPGADNGSVYIAAFTYKHSPRGEVRKRPPITIGLGGGSYGDGVGIGGGASFGIGGGRVAIVATELSVQLKRRGDNSVLWEGRAITEGPSGPGSEQPGVTAGRLAEAMFKGFPGESGITITVK